MSLRKTLFPALVLLSLTPALRAELVDNPLFVAWSKAPVGSSLTLKMAQEIRNAPAQEEIGTLRLTAVAGDSITAELGFADGRPDSQRWTVPARIEKGEETMFMIAPNQRGKVALKDHSENKESLTIDGKVTETIRYEATVAEIAGQNVQIISLKVWIAPTLPSGLVKIEIDEAAANRRPAAKETLTTIAWNAPGAAPASQPAATNANSATAPSTATKP